MSRDDKHGLRAADIAPGECLKGQVGERAVAIFNIEGQLYATQAACTHVGGPLCEGGIWNDVVTCPWHGSQFNVRTGAVVDGPAERPLLTYSVEVKDGFIVVDLDSKINTVAQELESLGHMHGD